MLNKIANYLGLLYTLEEDSQSVNSCIRERLDRMDALPYLYDQKAKPITFRYKSDTISLLPRQNSGQSQFPRINVKYTHDRKEVAQFVLEVRDQELAVKQYNAPPIIHLNKLQKVLKVHRKTKASAALFFLTRIIDRTQTSRKAKKLQLRLQELNNQRNELARTEVVPINAKAIMRQTTQGLLLIARILKKLSHLETPATKQDTITKLQGILDIANHAGDIILERANQYPELKVSVKYKPTRRALSRVVKGLANTSELDELQGSINHLKDNLRQFEALKNRN